MEWRKLEHVLVTSHLVGFADYSMLFDLFNKRYVQFYTRSFLVHRSSIQAYMDSEYSLASDFKGKQVL